MNKSIRCLALIAFVFASLVICAHFPAKAQNDTDTLANTVVHLLVTTSNGSQEGSGVIVSPDGIIFTAAHVVEDASEIRVELFDGFDASPTFGYFARIQYISPYEDFDFAILEIKGDEQGAIDPENLRLPFIQTWAYEVDVSDQIRTIGYLESAGGVPHVTAGIIGSTPERPILIGETTQDRYTFYQMDAVAGAGDSGGLVVNSDNEFIGIPIQWEDDGGGYVATILPIVTICKIHSEACAYEPPPIATATSPELSDEPFREHQSAAIGSGPLMQVTYSDGLAPFTQEELDTYHYRILRIRVEENPNGCGISIYNTNKIWFSAASLTTITVNGQSIANLSVTTGRHGYIFEWPIKIGDEICVTDIPPAGYQFVIGPDLYYHYDSYCYRGHC